MKKILFSAVALFVSFGINAQGQGSGSGGNLNANTQWKTTGNTAQSTDFVGTTNQQPLIFKTNNTEAMRVDPTGKIIFSKLTSTNGDGVVIIGGGGEGGRIDFTHNFTHVLNGQGIFTDISTFTGLTVSGNNIIQTTSGNIGFGVSNPTAKISVAGGGSFTGNLNIGGNILSNAITTNTLFAGTLSSTSLSTSAMTASTINVSSLSGGTGLSEVYVDQSGNLKIAPPPGTGLACATNSLKWDIGGNKIGPYVNVGYAPMAGTCDNFDFVLKANNTPYVWIKPDGKVGIGAPYPTAMFEVGTSNSINPFNITDGVSSLFSVDANGNTVINGTGSSTVPTFAVKNSSGSPLTIESNGHVIINKDPSQIHLAHLQVDVPASDQTPPFIILNKNVNLFGVQPNGSTVIYDGDPADVSPLLTLTHSNGSTLQFLANGTGDLTSSGSLRPHFAAGSDFIVCEGTPGSGQQRIGIAPGGGITVQTNHGTAGGSNALDIVNNTATSGLSVGGTSVFSVRDDGSTVIKSLAIANASPLTVQNTSYSSANKNAFEVNSDGYVTIRVNGASANSNILDIKDYTAGDFSNFRIKGNGHVYARELVVVNPTTSFPDYVFQSNYQLMPLKEVKKYIDSNHHLANMPTAEQVKVEGASIGEIQRVSVEKIEELFLYVIDLNAKVEKLEKENAELKKQLKK